MQVVSLHVLGLEQRLSLETKVQVQILASLGQDPTGANIPR